MFLLLRIQFIICIVIHVTFTLQILPLPNVPFFWILYRTYSHWRALQVCTIAKLVWHLQSILFLLPSSVFYCLFCCFSQGLSLCLSLVSNFILRVQCFIDVFFLSSKLPLNLSKDFGYSLKSWEVEIFMSHSCYILKPTFVLIFSSIYEKISIA